MNSKFLIKDRPTLTAMLKASTTENLLAQIEKILEQGTDAFGFQIDMLKPEERCENTYRTIFNAIQGKPCYVTNYYRGNSTPKTDDELMDGLFTAVSCADTLDSIIIDMPGDTFDRVSGEFTENPEAVEKQIKVIEKFHSMGAEVLMSSHVLKYIPCNEVLKIANGHKERGADVSKIVTDANSDAELLNNLRTSVVLKETLGIPSLFLCNGTHCEKHRILGPALGSDMFLVIENSLDGICPQPTIKKAKEILSLAGYKDLPKGV